MMMKYLLAFLLGLLLTGSALAHGGEDHGGAAATTPAGATSFSVAALSEQFEVLLRYEPLEKGQDAHLQLFLSDYATNAPIKGAVITITSPEDGSLKFSAKEQEPGIYLVEGQFPANQKYSLATNIVVGEKADLMLLEGIEVGRKLPTAEATATDAAGLFNWKNLLLLAGAFLAGVLLTVILLRRRRPTPLTPTTTPVVYENQA